jgi:hypothetical protein
MLPFLAEQTSILPKRERILPIPLVCTSVVVERFVWLLELHGDIPSEDERFD